MKILEYFSIVYYRIFFEGYKVMLLHVAQSINDIHHMPRCTAERVHDALA